MPRRKEILGHTAEAMKKAGEDGPSDIRTSSLARRVPLKGIRRGRVLTGGRPGYVDEGILGEGGQEKAIDLHKKLEQYLSAILVREKLSLFRPDTPAVVVADWIKSLLTQTKIQEEGATLLCTGSGDVVSFSLIYHEIRYPYDITVKDLYKKYFSK